MTITVTQDRTVRDELQLDAPVAPAATVRALVLDRNPATLRAACDALTAAGASVSRAMSHGDALKMVDRAPYDLILIDLDFPGYEELYLRAVGRSMREGENRPITVALSRSSLRWLFSMADRSVFDMVLTQPVTQDGLAAIVAQLMERRGATSEALVA